MGSGAAGVKEAGARALVLVVAIHLSPEGKLRNYRGILLWTTPGGEPGAKGEDRGVAEGDRQEIADQLGCWGGLLHREEEVGTQDRGLLDGVRSRRREKEPAWGRRRKGSRRAAGGLAGVEG